MKPAWIFFLASFCLLCFSDSDAQVPVAFAPPIHFQFFNANGTPLANGKIYTYAAGTTTLQNTYVDASGTTENADPILLDATGSPSNGSNQTGIFLANLSYKFVAYDANSVFQWSVDSVSSYFGLLNSANTWTAAQTFTSTITDTLTDNQMIFGGTGNQTTLDFPPPSGNIALHMPNTADTVVGRQTTDTLTNKTLISPSETTPSVNGVTVANEPGTYISVANASPTGTTASTLTKITGAPSAAIISATTDTGGVVGITVLGAGTTGNATIQETGIASCVFDGATTAGDYVQISTTTAGNCHDSGAGLPVGTQAVGRVLSTNGSSGTYQVILFSPEIERGSSVYANGAGSSGGGVGTTFQTIAAAAVPVSNMNVVGKAIRITAQEDCQPGTSMNVTQEWAFGKSTSLGGSGLTQVMTSETSSSSLLTATGTLTCVVQTTGASGVLQCIPTIVTSGTPYAQTGGFNITIDLTSTIYAGVGVVWGTSNSGNTCSSQVLVIEGLN